MGFFSSESGGALGWINLIMSLFEVGANSEEKKKYDAAVEQQIKEGRDGLQARSETALQMIQDDPSSNVAKHVMNNLRTRLPREAYDEVEQVVKRGNKRRTDFLGDYDRRTGQYLNQLDTDTGAMMQDFRGANAGLAAGFGQREADVMALLEGQGDQALKDTERVFGEETDASLADLNARGLGGSGVGSSVRSVGATRKADQLARIREDTGRLKATTLAGLRGDTLGFGERSNNLAAGFGETAINRRLGAYGDAATGRFAYDSAMSGQLEDRRQNALNRAYEMDTNLNTQYADYMNNRGMNRVDTYLNTTGDYWDFLNNVNNVPPDSSGAVNRAYSAGAGAARR